MDNLEPLNKDDILECGRFVKKFIPNLAHTDEKCSEFTTLAKMLNLFEDILSGKTGGTDFLTEVDRLYEYWNTINDGVSKEKNAIKVRSLIDPYLISDYLVNSNGSDLGRILYFLPSIYRMKGTERAFQFALELAGLSARIIKWYNTEEYLLWRENVEHCHVIVEVGIGELPLIDSTITLFEKLAFLLLDICLVIVGWIFVKNFYDDVLPPDVSDFTKYMDYYIIDPYRYCNRKLYKDNEVVEKLFEGKLHLTEPNYLQGVAGPVDLLNYYYLIGRYEKPILKLPRLEYVDPKGFIPNNLSCRKIADGSYRAGTVHKYSKENIYGHHYLIAAPDLLYRVLEVGDTRLIANGVIKANQKMGLPVDFYTCFQKYKGGRVRYEHQTGRYIPVPRALPSTYCDPTELQFEIPLEQFVDTVVYPDQQDNCCKLALHVGSFDYYANGDVVACPVIAEGEEPCLLREDRYELVDTFVDLLNKPSDLITFKRFSLLRAGGEGSTFDGKANEGFFANQCFKDNQNKEEYRGIIKAGGKGSSFDGKFNEGYYVNQYFDTTPETNEYELLSKEVHHLSDTALEIDNGLLALEPNLENPTVLAQPTLNLIYRVQVVGESNLIADGHILANATIGELPESTLRAYEEHVALTIRDLMYFGLIKPVVQTVGDINEDDPLFGYFSENGEIFAYSGDATKLVNLSH